MATSVQQHIESHKLSCLFSRHVVQQWTPGLLYQARQLDNKIRKHRIEKKDIWSKSTSVRRRRRIKARQRIAEGASSSLVTPPALIKMKFTLPAVLLAVAVSAQSTSESGSSSSTCAAANIVDACLDTTNGYLAQCTDNADYQCKCDKYTAIMTCFNNCPNDPRSSSYANSKQLYCTEHTLPCPAISATLSISLSSSNFFFSPVGIVEPAATTNNTYLFFQNISMNASLYSSQTAQPTTTGSASAPVSAAATTTPASAGGDKVGASSSAATAKSTDAAKNGATEMLANTSGLMLAVAAIIAAVL
ncbi:hypothetical protein PG985_002334 [Apiospora marii]|uniref:uncharacterized protein n=1 Tax=Apiospora marii TaxID=335849 RepID=UPI00312EFAA5